MTTSHILVTISAAALVLAVALLIGPRRTSVLLLHGASSPNGRRLAVRPMHLIGAAGGGALGWVFFGGALAAGLAAGAGLGVAIWLGLRADPSDAAAKRELTKSFPLVLRFLAAVVQTGAPVRSAANAVCDVADEPNAGRLRSVLARCDVGFTDAEAWRTLADDPVWGDVARELSRCVETGAATGDVLLTAATQASKTAAASAITAARSVGVSSTLPLVCCFLPAFLLVGVVPIIGGLIGGYVSEF